MAAVTRDGSGHMRGAQCQILFLGVSREEGNVVDGDYIKITWGLRPLIPY